MYNLHMPLSKTKLTSVPGISPLTIHDEPLFRTVFSKQYYAHSWLYVLRASHLDNGKEGFKFYDKELVAVIGYRSGYYYVTPIVDTTQGVRLRQLCDQIIQATGEQVILKKLPETILESEIPTRDDIVPLEDDTVGETILYLDRLFVDDLGTMNPMVKHIVRRANSFAAKNITLAPVDDIRKVKFEAIDSFLSTWPEKYQSYISMVRYLHAQPHASKQYRCMVFIQGDTVQGVYITEKLALAEIGFYCGVTSKDVPGITEWMDMHFLRVLHEEGVRRVYLGGAENLGIARFVNKLLPLSPRYRVRATLYVPSGSQVSMKIRKSTEQDIMPLAELYKHAYNTLHVLDERWTKETAHAFISHFYRRQPDLFFVAEVNGKIVSAAVAAIQPWWDGNHLVEGEVFTDPAYNNTGIERHLVRELIVAAREKYHVVAWDTIMPNIHNHPLGQFEAFGFTEIPHWKAVSADVASMLARLR